VPIREALLVRFFGVDAHYRTQRRQLLQGVPVAQLTLHAARRVCASAVALETLTRTIA